MGIEPPVPDPQPSARRIWILGPSAALYYYVRNKRRGTPTARIAKQGCLVSVTWLAACLVVFGVLPFLILGLAATSGSPAPVAGQSGSTSYAAPSQSVSTGYTAPTPAITSDPLDRAQETCQGFTESFGFEPVDIINNVIAYCGVNLPQGSFDVEFGTDGQVYLNPCSDYSWVTANGDQLSPNCGAPPESAARAEADCQSGAWVDPNGPLVQHGANSLRY
jgi:hypothetical protein